MRSIEYTIPWTINDQDIKVTVKYHPGHPGSWYKKNGDPGDPPEDAEIEILSVTQQDRNGEIIDVTDLYEDQLLDCDNFNQRVAESYEEPEHYAPGNVDYKTDKRLEQSYES